jgi:hypothetical protein
MVSANYSHDYCLGFPKVLLMSVLGTGFLFGVNGEKLGFGIEVGFFWLKQLADDCICN